MRSKADETCVNLVMCLVEFFILSQESYAGAGMAHLGVASNLLIVGNALSCFY